MGEQQGRRRRAPQAAPTQVVWSKSQARFAIRSSPEQWANLVQFANSLQDMPEPTDVDSIRELTVKLGELLDGIPGCWGLGKSTDERGYVRKHILRKFVLWYQQRHKQAHWSNLDVADLMKVSPDMKEFLKPLIGRTLPELRDMFGLNPCMISCWACLLSQVQQKHRHVFNKTADAPALWDFAKSLKDRHGGEEASLRTLATLRHEALRGHALSQPPSARNSRTQQQ